MAVSTMHGPIEVDEDGVLDLRKDSKLRANIQKFENDGLLKKKPRSKIYDDESWQYINQLKNLAQNMRSNPSISPQRFRSNAPRIKPKPRSKTTDPRFRRNRNTSDLRSVQSSAMISSKMLSLDASTLSQNIQPKSVSYPTFGISDINNRKKNHFDRHTDRQESVVNKIYENKRMVGENFDDKQIEIDESKMGDTIYMNKKVHKHKRKKTICDDGQCDTQCSSSVMGGVEHTAMSDTTKTDFLADQCGSYVTCLCDTQMPLNITNKQQVLTVIPQSHHRRDKRLIEKYSDLFDPSCLQRTKSASSLTTHIRKDVTVCDSCSLKRRCREIYKYDDKSDVSAVKNQSSIDFIKGKMTSWTFIALGGLCGIMLVAAITWAFVCDSIYQYLRTRSLEQANSERSMIINALMFCGGAVIYTLDYFVTTIYNLLVMTRNDALPEPENMFGQWFFK